MATRIHNLRTFRSLLAVIQPVNAVAVSPCSSRKADPSPSVRNTVAILTDVSGFLEPGTSYIRVNSNRSTPRARRTTS